MIADLAGRFSVREDILNLAALRSGFVRAMEIACKWVGDVPPPESLP